MSPLCGVRVFSRGPVSAVLGKPHAAAVVHPCGKAAGAVDGADLADDGAAGFVDDAVVRLGVAEVAEAVAVAGPELVAVVVVVTPGGAADPDVVAPAALMAVAGPAASDAPPPQAASSVQAAISAATVRTRIFDPVFAGGWSSTLSNT
jgi:hypothetical protein